ncbi:MAG: AzlC family ABC transporter permease [Clostridia bacterium]|nr:AzlC family ABC transporter permease [Clostridia bacterium]
MTASNKKAFREGFRDGIPIGLGYLAVAFSLGITARASGLNWLQAFIASATSYASAGEYAGFTVIGSGGSYIEMALMILVANCRYMLMSAALSQRLAADMPYYHRFLMATHVTDELFGINIARPGKIVPAYDYAAFLASGPAWAVGTAVGVIAGNVLPDRIVSALSVALFGMFIAIIVPPAKKNRVIAALVLVSFALSFACGKVPYVRDLSSGIRIIILTVVIASAAAILFPVKDEEKEGESGA